MEKVVIAGCESYEKESLKALFARGFFETGFKPDHSRILLKPNLLSGRTPEQAVTTHPVVLRALAELLLDAGCEVHLGDSPGYEPLARVMKKCGITPVVEDLGLTVAGFDQKIIMRNDGFSPYKGFSFGEDPAAYDAVINLPKLKTHTMMGVTMGVKNTFGFIRAFEKGKWHLRAGKDRDLFASVLIDIHNLVKPALTILDGIRGMDGEGPANGRPRDFGLVAISRDAFVLDRAMEDLLGISSPMPVSERALQYGLLKEHRIVDLGVPTVKGFLLPRSMMATDWSLPPFVKRLLRGVFVKKPRVDQKKCRKCGICIDICPAKALSSSNRGPEFDYRQCIRCYCCQEMCPEGAVVV